MGDELSMSYKERDRLKVMERVLKRNILLADAAKILDLSYRQSKRIYRRYKKEGDKGIIHRSRGKISKRAIDDETREAVIKTFKKKYLDFGPTLAAEKLMEDDGYKVAHETLRRWLIKDGIYIKRRRRKAYRMRRERKEHFGEMVQMDGVLYHDKLNKCSYILLNK
jgi:transposase